MENNYQEKRALDSMMKNGKISRSLGLEKRQNAVLDVMIKQKITTDPNKLAGYKKEAFIKAINKRTDLGFYGKKALNEVYGEKKQEQAKPTISMKDEIAAKRQRYDEIMNKKKSLGENVSKVSPLKNDDSPIVNLSVSQKRIRQAEQARLLGSSGSESSIYGKSFQQGNHSDGNEDIKSRLRSIQS